MTTIFARPDGQTRASRRRGRGQRATSIVKNAMNMPYPPQSPAGVPTCYRHPDRQTYIGCTRCGRPACPECLRSAAVGHQCVDCVAVAAASVPVAKTAAGGVIRTGTPLVSYGLIAVNVLVFLLANVITSRPQQSDVAAAAAAAPRIEPVAARDEADPLERLGPGYPLLFLLPRISAQRIFSPEADGQGTVEAAGDARIVNETTARVMAILSQLAIVAGMVFTGWRHFENARLGIAAAVLYLLLPYTAIMTGRVDHALPGALVIWAIATYRLPLASGFLIGMAMGTTYYPVFLLPLWCSFYWERGIRRFAVGVAVALALLVAALWWKTADPTAFAGQLRQMFGWIFPNEVTLEGFWALPANDAVFRLPVLAAFVAMMATLAIWPSPKNLGTLMSCTAAVLIGSQFWKAHDGGLFLAWFLPVLLLVVFRPNLENRVALLVLEPEWFPRRARQAA